MATTEPHADTRPLLHHSTGRDPCQPFRFCWSDGTSHVPDFFARNADGSAVVVDVRGDDRIGPADQEVFAKSESTCRSIGWGYRRVGKIDPTLLANVRWLSGYRHPRVCRIGVAEELLAVFSQPRPLMVGAGLVGDTVHVLPVLFHLLWHQRLVVEVAS
ncbi:TnsA-like heteromeric transposase endonuclease subunit [Mycobacterium avium]|uniref:TnsA-like heteromeric transposase endonuclease subunit n=1 Tax=Mycobacterium avium TaxID=1764 RepID=UPI001EE2C238|nr:TnsA-like heteromeric transposase endonuclease subunit [Mycobacterium avium]